MAIQWNMLQTVAPPTFDVDGINSERRKGMEARRQQALFDRQEQQYNAMLAAANLRGQDRINAFYASGNIDAAMAMERLGISREEADRAIRREPFDLEHLRASTDASRAGAAGTRASTAETIARGARDAALHPYAVARAADATSDGRAALFDRHFPPGAADDATRAERRARFIATGAIADRPESVKFTALPPGGAVVAHDARTGAVVGRYEGPDKPPDSTSRRAMYEAEDALPGLRGTIEGLREARELLGSDASGVPRAYHGFGSGLRSSVNLGTPDVVGTGVLTDRARAEATRRLSDLLSGEAISAMSATLKGATTDREMAAFVRMMADPSTTPEIKRAQVESMLRRAEREYTVKMDRIRELGGRVPPELSGVITGAGPRPGAVYAPPGGRPGAPPPATGAPSGAPASDLRRALESATPGTTYKFPNGETRVKGPDGNWYLPGEVPR